jgi:single-strand DNA-binding protein
MANVNKVILIGNVTRDIELKYTKKGTAVASASLALNRSFKNEQGEKHEEVTFVDVEFWGRVAEVVSEYVKKGSPLYVEGRLKQETWEDKESGGKRQRIKVVAENIQLLSSRGQKKSESVESAEGPVTRPLSSADDDIPF